MSTSSDERRLRFRELAALEPEGTSALAWEDSPLAQPSEAALATARRMLGSAPGESPLSAQRRLIKLAGSLDRLLLADQQTQGADHPTAPCASHG